MDTCLFLAIPAGCQILRTEHGKIVEDYLPNVAFPGLESRERLRVV